MLWVDVCGSPGVGKSTLCDALWHPHAFPPSDELPPADWQPFTDEITRLFVLIRAHWSFGAAVRMNRRSARKMATVARMAGNGPYVQTGLVQRGLGFGWRLMDMGIDLDHLRPFFRLMPVSIGVVFLSAAPEVIEARNRKRLENPATAHENRAFMVPLMAEAIEVSKQVLAERGVPTIEIRTDQPIEQARSELAVFASRPPCDAAPVRSGSEASVLQAPPWW